MTQQRNSFRGNKASLPVKPCTVCGRDMVWRKAWAKNWDEVKYCSAYPPQFHHHLHVH